MEHLWNQSDTACIMCSMGKNPSLIAQQPSCPKRPGYARPIPASVVGDDICERLTQIRGQEARQDRMKYGSSVDGDAMPLLAMYPTKLTATDPESERELYKIVRRDLMIDVPGLILSANADAGVCILRLSNGASQEYNYGPGGLMIVLRG